MKAQAHLAAVAVAMLLLATGCQTSMTGVAPCTTPITENDTYTVISETPAKGNAWGFHLLFPISEADPSRTAVDRAIRNGGGDALIEVGQDFTVINLFVAMIFRTRVMGTPIKISRGSAKR